MKNKRFLKPRTSVYLVLFTIGLFILSAPGRAQADSIFTYNFSGDLAAGGMVTGTFTLDTTDSALPAFDFTTPIGPINSTNSTPIVFALTPAQVPNTDFVQLAFVDASIDATLLLYFQTSLSGFTGSTPLYTAGVESGFLSPVSYSSLFCDTNCTEVSFFTSGNAIQSGGAGPTAAPEPSSLLLLATGLLGLAPFLRRRA
jgi:PEP-CTERM motif-containing protein